METRLSAELRKPCLAQVSPYRIHHGTLPGRGLFFQLVVPLRGLRCTPRSSTTTSTGTSKGPRGSSVGRRHVGTQQTDST